MAICKVLFILGDPGSDIRDGAKFSRPKLGLVNFASPDFAREVFASSRPPSRVCCWVCKDAARQIQVDQVKREEDLSPVISVLQARCHYHWTLSSPFCFINSEACQALAEDLHLSKAVYLLLNEPRGTSGVHLNKWRNVFFSDSSYTLLDLYEVSSLLLYTQFCAKLDSTHFYTG